MPTGTANPPRPLSADEVRGSGHANRLLIRDYAAENPATILRVETEIRRSELNKVKFDQIANLLQEAETEARNAKIVKLCHQLVEDLRGAPRGRKTAKDMFSVAFGQALSTEEPEEPREEPEEPRR
jgi:hypothetical protein